MTFFQLLLYLWITSSFGFMDAYNYATFWNQPPGPHVQTIIGHCLSFGDLVQVFKHCFLTYTCAFPEVVTFLRLLLAHCEAMYTISNATLCNDNNTECKGRNPFGKCFDNYFVVLEYSYTLLFISFLTIIQIRIKY